MIYRIHPKEGYQIKVIEMRAASMPFLQDLGPRSVLIVRELERELKKRRA